MSEILQSENETIREIKTYFDHHLNAIYANVNYNQEIRNNIRDIKGRLDDIENMLMKKGISKRPKKFSKFGKDWLFNLIPSDFNAQPMSYHGIREIGNLHIYNDEEFGDNIDIYNQARVSFNLDEDDFIDTHHFKRMVTKRINIEEKMILISPELISCMIVCEMHERLKGGGIQIARPSNRWDYTIPEYLARFIPLSTLNKGNMHGKKTRRLSFFYDEIVKVLPYITEGQLLPQFKKPYFEYHKIMSDRANQFYSRITGVKLDETGIFFPWSYKQKERKMIDNKLIERDMKKDGKIV